MHVPTATYRIQFNPAWGFPHAKRIIPYLKQLGISDLYASPVFKAKKGSTHGYDVTDPCSLNPQLGTVEDFEQLLKEVIGHGMGWVQDVVPNHMAFDGQNAWLMDVLEKGRNSAYWKYFDIEWKDAYQSLKGKVLTPFLGQFYSRCLAGKEIQVNYRRGNLTVHYYDLRMPLRIETYKDVFLPGIDKLKRALGERSKTYLRYKGVMRQMADVSSKSGKRFEKHVERIKTRLWELYTGNKKIRSFVKHNISMINGKKGNAESFHLLDQLLSRQQFRLTFWKFGTEEINYRRFFNINQLISVRVENREVFERTHELVLRLARQGKISGLRIDHIDGLYDPETYLKRLRGALNDHYIVVEKVLGQEEPLPDAWPVEGTTGYDFLNYVNGLFVDRKNERVFSGFYRQIVKKDIPFDELVSSKKRLIVGKHMAGDVDNLAHHMKRVSYRDHYGRDITSYGLRRALVEVLAHFPRYRTYISGKDVRDDDRAVITEAVTKAKESNPGLVYELDFIADILLLNFKNYLSANEKDRWVHFVRRFQQFTGPLMAKGFEDTTLYIYNRLISLNEVGGSPSRFGVLLKEFHRLNRAREAHWPQTMNATATHDTKRGEDARARINVISEMPDQWMKKVKSWQKLNREKKTGFTGKTAPDDNDEYFLYQTLVGGLPFDAKEYNSFKRRLKDYVIKAVREAKVHTAWIQPDERYEKAYLRFIDRILEPSGKNVFLRDLLGFQKEISHYGIFNSLSQTLIKLTAPGVPDFYQGCELWDFSFVDPDNRRPVDFDQRRKFLDDIERRPGRDRPGLIRRLMKNRENGQIKLYLIKSVLDLRNRRKEIFMNGAYIPLRVTGKYRENIAAFARGNAGRYALTVAPRFLTKVADKNKIPIGEIWGNTCVAMPEGGRWKDWLTASAFDQKRLYIKDVFKYFPGAVLTNAYETR